MAVPKASTAALVIIRLLSYHAASEATSMEGSDMQMMTLHATSGAGEKTLSISSAALNISAQAVSSLDEPRPGQARTSPWVKLGFGATWKTSGFCRNANDELLGVMYHDALASETPASCLAKAQACHDAIGVNIYGATNTWCYIYGDGPPPTCSLPAEFNPTWSGTGPITKVDASSGWECWGPQPPSPAPMPAKVYGWTDMGNGQCQNAAGLSPPVLYYDGAPTWPATTLDECKALAEGCEDAIGIMAAPSVGAGWCYIFGDGAPPTCPTWLAGTSYAALLPANMGGGSGPITQTNGGTTYECWAMYAIPTLAPTPAPTASPVNTAGSANGGSSFSSPTSAKGDPHLQNINGQRFDLMRPGRHVLLHIPRGADVPHVLLRVEADVQRLGLSCGEMYFQHINITGAWVEAKYKGILQFHAGEIGGEEESAWMTFGAVDLKVVHGHNQLGTRYLNIYAKHLGRTGFKVGGLLGEDDHENEATPDQDCVPKLDFRILPQDHLALPSTPLASSAEATLA